MIIEGLKTGLRVKIEDLTIALDTETIGADVYLWSQEVRSSKFGFSKPGEYEVKNIFIFGAPVQATNKGTLFLIRNRDWRFGYLPFSLKRLGLEQKNLFLEADAIFTLPESLSFVQEELAPRLLVTKIEPARLTKLAKSLGVTPQNLRRVNLKTVETPLINLYE